MNGAARADAVIERAQHRISLADERAVLGAMLLANPAGAMAVDIRDLLRPGENQPGRGEHHFTMPAHQLVWQTILALMDRAEPHDLNSVWAAIPVDQQQRWLANGAYLSDLAAACPSVASGSYYAKNLAHTTLLRGIADAAAAAAQAAGESSLNDAVDVLDAAQRRLNDLVPPGRAGAMVSWGVTAPEVADEIERLERLANSPDVDTETVFSTPWPDLNRLLGPIAPGSLIVLAGRPGMAKSTAMRDIARHLGIARRRPAPIFSLEMGRMEMGIAVMAATARVRTEDIKNGTLSDDDWVRIAKYVGEAETSKLEFDDTPTMNQAYIDRALAAVTRKYGEPPAAYFFDYLQLAKEHGFSNRQEEVSAMSRGHKLLTKKHHTVGVVLSQLNRGPEQRADKRPQLSDLRESGSIEQDADVVILLHRDDYYDPECPNAGEIDFIVAKHRNGPTGVITLAAQLHMSRIASMAVDG